MFQRILVRREGLTLAEQGSLIAARIARASDNAVILLHEAPVALGFGAHPQPRTEPQDMVNLVSTEMARLLSATAQAQASPGSEMSVASVPGPAVLTISDPAHAKGSDLILITAPAAASLEPWMLEQVAQRAVLYPPVPLLVLHDEASSLAYPALEAVSLLHPPTAAVALDGSRQAEAAILPAAHPVATLAAPATGALHLTHVVLRPSVDALLYNQERIDPYQRDQMIQEAMDYLCHMTYDLRASLEGKLPLTITWSITLDSDVMQALVGVAERGHVVGGTCLSPDGCDFLALATHGRDKKGYWVPGNVTERLFSTTDLPLLLV